MRDEGGAERFGVTLPSKAAFTLVAIHVTAFVFLGLANFRDLEPIRALLPLAGSESSWLAIFLHPIATRDFLPVLITVFAIWTLGGRIEARWGAVRMLGYYLTGNVIAGAVYFGLMHVQPAMAGVPLVMPIGGLVAWVLLEHRAVQLEEARARAEGPGYAFSPTNFERKYIEEGRIIRRYAFRRVPR